MRLSIDFENGNVRTLRRLIVTFAPGAWAVVCNFSLIVAYVILLSVFITEPLILSSQS
jgi:hypothetical protein